MPADEKRNTCFLNELNSNECCLFALNSEGWLLHAMKTVKDFVLLSDCPKYD